MPIFGIMQRFYDYNKQNCYVVYIYWIINKINVLLAFAIRGRKSFDVKKPCSAERP